MSIIQAIGSIIKKVGSSESIESNQGEGTQSLLSRMRSNNRNRAAEGKQRFLQQQQTQSTSANNAPSGDSGNPDSLENSNGQEETGDGFVWGESFKSREYERKLVSRDVFFHETRHFPLSTDPESIHCQNPNSDTRSFTQTAYGPMHSPLVIGVPCKSQMPDDPEFVRMFDTLDIRRITNRVIACGLPSSSRTDVAVHRNNIHDLAAFLDTRYGSRYMIWNIAGILLVLIVFILIFIMFFFLKKVTRLMVFTITIHSITKFFVSPCLRHTI